MRVLVTGSSGFLGKYLMMELSRLGHAVFGISRGESPWTNFCVDICERAALRRALDAASPDVIVHAAAWPDVEGCEVDRDKSFRINVQGTRNVSEWCGEKGRRMVFISTDYVYGGNGEAPNSEDAPVGHMNYYTECKLEGERAASQVEGHLILRTGFIYGLDPGGKNFLMQMLSGREVVVARDQVVNPTAAPFLAEMVGLAIGAGLCGTRNCNGAESFSRTDFANLIAKTFGRGRMIGKLTSEMGYRAKRPLCVKIDSSRIYAELGKSPKATAGYLSEMRSAWELTKIDTFRRTECRGCGGKDVEMIFSYGRMPVANSFHRFPDLNAIPLEVMFCNGCSLVQIWDVITSESLFTDYRYLSSVSPALKRHFGDLAATLKARLGLTERSLIVEIGSNDGIFQEQGKLIGLEVLGIEPAGNVAALARGKGLQVINDFFSRKVVEEIVSAGGRADLIVGCNVLAHIDDMATVLSDARALLKDEGALVFEVHYVVDLVKNREYDNMYHEHVNEYNLTSVARMLERNGLVLSDVEHIPNHGGSLRVYARKRGSPSQAALRTLADEEAGGFTRKETYVKFFSEMEGAKRVLFENLNRLKCAGKRIAAYGASARGTIFLNYCNVGLNMLDFVVDKSPEKQGRHMPRNAVPIFAPQRMREKKPDCVLMVAYTYFAEIMREQAWYPGTWIIPLPEYSELAGRGEG